MLVLTRKEREMIDVSITPEQIAQLASKGEGVTLAVSVAGIDKERRKVRIGFEAPHYVKIYRRELTEPAKEQPKPELSKEATNASGA